MENYEVEGPWPILRYRQLLCRVAGVKRAAQDEKQCNNTTCRYVWGVMGETCSTHSDFKTEGLNLKHRLKDFREVDNIKIDHQVAGS